MALDLRSFPAPAYRPAVYPKGQRRRGSQGAVL